jgi:hypothetical protein
MSSRSRTGLPTSELYVAASFNNTHNHLPKKTLIYIFRRLFRQPCCASDEGKIAGAGRYVLSFVLLYSISHP